MTHPIDELKFQQRLLEDPNHLDEEMLAFLEENPTKKSVVKKAKAFDEDLRHVLNVPVPEGLQERILIKNSFENQTAANDSSWFKPLSMFAASFLVVSVGLWTWLNPIGTDSVNSTEVAVMEQAVIDHLIEHAAESPEDMAQYESLSDKEVQELFTYVGATLNKPIDFMSYAGGCEIDGKRGLHVVLQEEEGPVTIIVLPGEKLSGMYAFAKEGFKGNMMPVKGGVVAIIGSNEKQLAMAQMHFFKAVSFDS